jgi:hypothetical protein
MTKQMIQIQGAIIDCIEACLSDLKRAHPSVSCIILHRCIKLNIWT